MIGFSSIFFRCIRVNFPGAIALFSCVWILVCQGVASAAVIDKPTYTRDIMPVFQESCQLCHSPERIAPMSFMNYKEVRPWAKAIRKVVADRTMPPFHAETELGEFQNDLRLASEEIELILRWVDNGAPKGNPADAPPVKVLADAKWELDAPDLVIEYPEHTLSGEDEDEYILFHPTYRFAEDTWIEMIEFRGSDYRSVHHAGLFAVDEFFPVPESGLRDIGLPPFDKTLKLRERPKNPFNVKLLQQNYLYTWAPGFGIHRLSPGEGILIRKGESIVVQAHLSPSEEPVEVSMSLALKFVDGFITKSSHKIGALVGRLEIPPGESNYEIRKRRKVKETIQVYGSWTHMHLRGKSNRFVFHYPDGRVETAFNIPKYSFDWQRPYFLKESVTVPEGTTIEYIGVWDNSSGNPLNPDPTQTVYWGGSTFDEMYGSTLYYWTNLDTPLEVRNGIAVTK